MNRARLLALIIVCIHATPSWCEMIYYRGNEPDTLIVHNRVLCFQLAADMSESAHDVIAEHSIIEADSGVRQPSLPLLGAV